METPWYKLTHVASSHGLFRQVGMLFNATFKAMVEDAGTDFFSTILLLILFGLVAGFLLYMIRTSKK